MFAAILLSISVVALSQFALYYWRAVLAAVATPVSARRVGCGAGGQPHGDRRGFRDLRDFARTDADAGSAGRRAWICENVLLDRQ